MARLEQTPARYLHSPRLISVPHGTAVLSLIAWEGDAEHVLRVPVAADGQLGAPVRDAEGPRVVALSRGDRAVPTEDDRVEQEEQRDGERVWVEQGRGQSTVWLVRGGLRTAVFRGACMAAAPTLARAASGTWVSFHHDLREDTAARDVAKWIALRFVTDAGEVFMPAAGMSGRDRDLAGVEQSFEFPALVVAADGALALFGRGSHNFYRQDLNAVGFSARMPLSDGEWGSRGRHIVAAPIAAGLVVARRDRKGIEVDAMPAPLGGAPKLVPAPVVASVVVPVAATSRPRRLSADHDIYFGDIQQHSAHSDGIGSADEVYLRARDLYGDDFVALTDHEAFVGKRTGPGEWEYLQRVADRYNDAPHFATLLAYEWTGKMHPGPGHKCVYYPERGLPIVSRDDVPEGRALVQRVHALGGLASPHHIGWTGADEAGHDDLGQPVWEICSCHGCYEHPQHPLGARGNLVDQTADVFLRRGHRFGFTASSDSHGLLWHHGESRKRDPYRTGLTAVLLRGLSRAGILEALRARRCYATSGAKILLDVRVDSAPMGSVLHTRDAMDVSVTARGTDALASVELVGPAGVIARVEPSAEHGALSARVDASYVYARVTQRDGEMAWSSPVFR
jgi:hypothetical protein